LREEQKNLRPLSRHNIEILFGSTLKKSSSCQRKGRKLIFEEKINMRKLLLLFFYDIIVREIRPQIMGAKKS
jgi:hypothetical protein